MGSRLGLHFTWEAFGNLAGSLVVAALVDQQERGLHSL